MHIETNLSRPRQSTVLWVTALASLALCAADLHAQDQGRAVAIETEYYHFQLSPENGSYRIRDKQADVTWRSNPYRPRFGEVTLKVSGKPQRFDLARCDVRLRGEGWELVFHPLADKSTATVRVVLNPRSDGRTLDIAYEADPGLDVASIRLLDQALWVTDTTQGYVLLPVRLGLLVPADSGLTFTYPYDTFAYEGCHMEMLGVVRSGAAALVTWHDPYVLVELTSALPKAGWVDGKQVVSPSLVLSKSARSFRIEFLGKGDYLSLGEAYRKVAKEKGWLVSWDEKLKDHPDRAKLFGAVNYKLWSTLSRRMNEESTNEESARVNWTFDEAAQMAEHLHQDLKLDKVLFLMGGWIHRGYDNQHPDIMPAAPECGGNDALADCARRVMRLGYLFGLHDNYQDIYRDSPSWAEDLIMKGADGSLAAGGRWNGGRAYLTCSQKAVELAKRPQNLPAVKQLTDANAYFIDTTYAAGLQECFDPKHPLTRGDDLKWKQAISDYARDLFGIFGSECGREWAIPHSDFFEGMTGVSGRYYHNAELLKKVGGTVVPLFEIVYRDCIAMYGKYGYDFSEAAEYVLQHLSIGRPLNYHNLPPHLYWKDSRGESPKVAARPSVAECKPTGPRRFDMTYQWTVQKTPADDLHVFVHFTDREGRIRFQNDYLTATPTSQWQPGELRHGPHTVVVSPGLTGTFDVRMGLYQRPLGPPVELVGFRGADRTCVVGTLTVTGDRIEFAPRNWADADVTPDPALFTRGHNGWTDGLHRVDRFVKNTYEILSPLNEITSRMRLTGHEFLTPDRKVQRTAFGKGDDAVTVWVNAGTGQYRCPSAQGGDVLLPPYGFLVESPTFVAFHALSWGGLRYDQPVMFTLRSQDGKPLLQSGKVRIYHAFGDARVTIGNSTPTVESEFVGQLR